MLSVSLNKVALPHVSLPVANMETSGGSIKTDFIPPAIKEAMILWYDPLKQGLTNEDIVTKYNQDLNKVYSRSSTTTTIISKDNRKVVIQNVNADNYSIAIDITYANYVNQPWTYTYTTTNVSSARIAIYDRNGTITFPAQSSNGILNVPILSLDEQATDKNIVMMFVLKNKEIAPITINQLPTSILQDFSGNGRVGYCYNFAGEGNSGVGLYHVNFKSSVTNSNNSCTNTFEKIVIHRIGGRYSGICAYGNNTFLQNPFKIKVTGIPKGLTTILQYRYYDVNNEYKFIVIKEDGLYDMPKSYPSLDNVVGFISTEELGDFNITIEQIPEYQNQIVFDGIDDCIYCPNQPILTDYTVIAGRTWFNPEAVSGKSFANKTFYEDTTGAFDIEHQTTSEKDTRSFGKSLHLVSFDTNEILVQSKNYYNDKYISSGTKIDTNYLVIGGIIFRSLNPTSYHFKGALRVFLLFNRTLTPDEITWVKNNLMRE